MLLFRPIIFIAVFTLYTLSCSYPPNKPANTGAAANLSNNVSNEQMYGGPEVSPTSADVADPSMANGTRQACYEVKTGDDVVMRSQTFPIDFEPFRGSCFVTTHNPEHDDPPLESHYAIYRNGKRIFDFPEQFNGVTFGCWVDAVSFQDVNSDNLKDVIVVGKCSAKAQPYNENMVYINTGKTFVTRPDGNSRLGDFTKAKDIADFVSDNQQIFFK